MIYSLNEIEALARKAARGGGMSWGLAEETGKAVRWLSDNGFSGPHLLADLLGINDGIAYLKLVPRYANGSLSAESGPLCPIIVGALICDRAYDLTLGDPIHINDVSVPLLLAPFIAAASRSGRVTVTLEWAGTLLTFDSGRVNVKAGKAALMTRHAKSAVLTKTETRFVASARTAAGRQMDKATLRVLESFAFRTYAPATEASRAGAGPEQDNE
tara:strand:+ start:1755 stop:2399 length:645 start_codon:yes stop_codon:yes gene_type:complete